MSRAPWFLVSAVVIWGCSFVATKVCLAWLDPVELLGLRLVLALPVLALLLRLRGVGFAFPRPAGRMFLGSAIIGAHWLIQIEGLKTATAVDTGWIIAVSPLAMALLAAVFLGERIRLPLAAGIAVASCGILLLVSKGELGDLQGFGSRGDWLVLVSAHTWAVYTILMRDLSRTQHPLALTFWVLVPTSCAVVGLMLLRSDVSRFLHLPTEVQLALVFLGVAAMALAHWFWQEGVARVGAARAGVFLYLEPLATTALAVPYLGEPFGLTTLMGGGLVLAGVALAQRRSRGLWEQAPEHPQADAEVVLDPRVVDERDHDGR